MNLLTTFRGCSGLVMSKKTKDQLNKLVLMTTFLFFTSSSLTAQALFESQNFNNDDGGFTCTFHEPNSGNPDCGVDNLGVATNIDANGPVATNGNNLWMQDEDGNQNPTCMAKSYDLSSLGLTDGDKIRIQFQYAADYGTGDASVGFFVKIWSDGGGDGMNLTPTFSSTKFNESGVTFTAVDVNINSTFFPDLSNVVIAFCLDSDGASATNTGAYLVIDTYSLLYFKKPAATYTVIEDCDNEQFSIEVEVTDVGSSVAGVDVTDGTTTEVNVPVGTYTFGPYASGTSVVIQVNGLNYGSSNISSDPLTGCFTELPIPASGSQTETICGGTFVDSGTSLGNYGNNESGSLTICPTGVNNLVQVAFSVFNTAANDALTIYDGNSTGATNLGSFSGTTSPGTITSSDATGCLTFQFNSDGATTAEGWVSEVTCVPATCSINVDNVEEINCGDGTYDAQITVTYAFLSPGNQVTITELNSSNTMTFNTAGSNGTQIFTLTGLLADGAADNFRVEDANDAACFHNRIFTSTCTCSIAITSVGIANCTGATYDANVTVNYSYLNAGNQITITESNSGTSMTFTAASHSGTETFTLTGLDADAASDNFTAVDGTDSSCSGTGSFTAPPNGCTPDEIFMGTGPSTINTCSALFYDSGGSTNNYSSNEAAILTICPSGANLLTQVSFTAFSTEATTGGAGYDGLMIYDGDDTNAPLINSGLGEPASIACSNLQNGGFWDNNSPGLITSNHASGCLTFQFCSDGSISDEGWEANVTCIPIECFVTITDMNITNCGGGFYDAALTVAYGFLSPGNQIKLTDQGSGTTMTFNAAGSNGTETFTLSGLASDGLVETFKAEDANDASCTSTTSNFSAPPSVCEPDEIIMGQVASPFSTCFGNFYDPGGPTDNYATFEEEILTICPGQANAKVRAIFSSFATEENYDGLMIYDGDSQAAPLIDAGTTSVFNSSGCDIIIPGAFYGDINPGTVVSTHSSGCLTFAFCSDVTSQEAGWEASISCVSDAPLAVEGLELEGRVEKNSNYLFWRTTTETETVAHIVQRSLNGRDNWETLGEVEAVGYSQTATSYEWIDSTPFDFAYYRIQTLNTNGISEFSSIIALDRSEKAIQVLEVAPNPTKNILHIEVMANRHSEQWSTLSILDLMGRIVFQEKVQTIEGINTYQLNLNDLAIGVYILKIENGRDSWIRKVVKE